MLGWIMIGMIFVVLFVYVVFLFSYLIYTGRYEYPKIAEYLIKKKWNKINIFVGKILCIKTFTKK